jgi:hypothetical protein
MVFLLITSDNSKQALTNTTVNKKCGIVNIPPKIVAPVEKKEDFTNNIMSTVVKPVETLIKTVENFIQSVETKNKAEKPVEAKPNNYNIKYETFANVDGIAENTYGAAPFGTSPAMEDNTYMKVNYTGLVEGTPGEAIHIEGTDLLTAPLVDNMLYTNSIANTNRNASQDMRGDIPVPFNESYTPFYSSTIYGAPLTERTMTLSNLPQ